MSTHEQRAQRSEFPRNPPPPRPPDNWLQAHAWQIIWGSVGFHVSVLLAGRMQNFDEWPSVVSLGGLRVAWLVLAGLFVFAGVLVGTIVQRRRNPRASPSGVKHLFILILQFALLFAVFKAWHQ